MFIISKQLFMVMILQNMLVVVGSYPQSMPRVICVHTSTITTTVQALFPYKCTVMSHKLTNTNTSSSVADSFPESMYLLA